MNISRIEHYRILMLISEVTKFKDGFYCNDDTPVVKSLDTFLTYLELLSVWDESANPWQKAVFLAGCDPNSKASAYLMNTMQRIERAEIEDIFTVIEVENDRLRKEVQKARIIDNDRIARIRELLDENKALQVQVEGFKKTNDDLIREAEELEAEHKRELEDREDSLESEVNMLETRITELENELDEVKRDLDTARTDLEDMTEERNNYRRDLRLTSEELDEVKRQLERYE